MPNFGLPSTLVYRRSVVQRSVHAVSKVVNNSDSMEVDSSTRRMSSSSTRDRSSAGKAAKQSCSTKVRSAHAVSSWKRRRLG
jgi:hypothetical protein